MAIVYDQIGGWEQLGSVIVGFDWLSFPIYPIGDGDLFRIEFNGLSSPPRTVVYLRSTYFTFQNVVAGREWVKLYPKEEREIIKIPFPLEFAYQGVIRNIEIIKRFPYKKIGSFIDDPNYTATLEEFVPDPSTVEQVQNKDTIKQAVVEALQENPDLVGSGTNVDINLFLPI